MCSTSSSATSGRNGGTTAIRSPRSSWTDTYPSCEPGRRAAGRKAHVSTVHARLPAGASAGHWTDARGRTGCTVLLVPAGAVAGVDVRGGAPGTINTDGLRPGTVTERAHAILLTGGSTFGLSAAAGVLRYLEERGTGLMFGSVAVPIVAG